MPNLPPTSLSLAQLPVLENVRGPVIGRLTAVDPDAGETITWAPVTSGYVIDGDMLRLGPTGFFNYESLVGGVAKVTVRATDSAGNTRTQAVSFQVTNVNEAPTAITLAPQPVLENARGATIGRLTGLDPDLGDTITWTPVTAGYVIDGDVLRLSPTSALDFDALPGGVATVAVRGTDSGGASRTQTLSFQVTNVNEAPTAIALAQQTVLENARAPVIGRLTAVDPDLGDTVTWTPVTSGYVIDGDMLRLGPTGYFNYETLVGGIAKVTVRATDSAGNSRTQAVSFQVTNVNEAPTAITLAPQTVLENVNGAVIGRLTAVDPDLGDTFTWATTTPGYVIDGDVLRLAPTTALNFESLPGGVATVSVRGTDSAGASRTQTLSFNVTNVNEAPTAITLAQQTVLENVRGPVIGRLTAVDPDAGDAITWAPVTSGYVIDGDVLRLGPTGYFNYETLVGGVAKVTVRATDSAGNTRTQALSFQVTDVNEAPTAIALSGMNIAGATAGATIGQLTVTDPDAGNQHGFRVSDTRFEVVGDTLKLKNGVALDPAAAATVTVRVTATDQGGLARTQALVITVDPGPLDVVDRAESYSDGGSAGAQGTSPYTYTGIDGGAGTDGGAGAGAAASMTGSWASGVANDSVVLARSASGGAGGDGGWGGLGDVGGGSVATSTPTRADYYFYDGGAGGHAGDGGAGGAGAAEMRDLSFALGGGTNDVRLSLTASGGDGGQGGLGGTGGSSRGYSRYEVLDWQYQRPDYSYYTAPYVAEYHGGAGGDGGDGGRGGDGADASVIFSGVRFVGGAGITIDGTALAGSGGYGGTYIPAYGAGVPGSGASGGDGGDGGASGMGGDARAVLEGLTVQATTYTWVSVDLRAQGGEGRPGGDGAFGAYGTAETSTTNGGQLVASSLAYIPGDNGNGGDGGDGGDATVIVTGTNLLLGDQAGDWVRFALTATAGMGGDGGHGANAVDQGANYPPGTPTGATGTGGLDAFPGWASVAFTNNTIALGGGDDVLQLYFELGGSGLRDLVFTGNTLDGGAGTDALYLGGLSAQNAANGEGGGATIDVAAGSLTFFGGGSGNILRGFEIFTGTEGRDVFIDGDGDQSYNANRYDYDDGNGDRYEFRAGGTGTDTFWMSTYRQDTIALIGFGPDLDSFAEVMAKTTGFAGNWQVELSASHTLNIYGAALLPADFVFA